MISRRTTLKISRYLYDNFTELKKVNYGAFGRTIYSGELKIW